MLTLRYKIALGALVFTMANAAAAQVNPKQGAVKVKERVKPAKVRILLRVTPYEKVVTRSPRGLQTYAYRPGQEIVHSLRGQINRPNHFYFGEWHVTSTPLSWRKDTRQFRVRLTFQKIYGAAANLEEAVGSIDVAGHLQPVDESMFNLIASERMLFRDLEGNPKLNIVAGFNPASDQGHMNVAKAVSEPQESSTR